MQFNVKGQSLTRIDKDFVVADSINYLQSKFIFDESWNGFTKYAHFQQGNQVYEYALKNAELNTASTSNKNCPNIIITDADMWIESINFTTNN